MLTILCFLSKSYNSMPIVEDTTIDFGTPPEEKDRFIIFMNPFDFSINNKPNTQVINKNLGNRVPVHAFRRPSLIEWETIDLDRGVSVDFILDSWDVPLVNNLVNKTITEYYVFVGPGRKEIQFDFLNLTNEYGNRINFTTYNNNKTIEITESKTLNLDGYTLGLLVVQQMVGSPIQFVIQSIKTTIIDFDKDLNNRKGLNYSFGPFYVNEYEHRFSASRNGYDAAYLYDNRLSGQELIYGICHLNIGITKKQFTIPENTLLIIHRIKPKYVYNMWVTGPNGQQEVVDDKVSAILCNEKSVLEIQSQEYIPFITFSVFNTENWPAVDKFYSYHGSRLFVLSTNVSDSLVETAKTTESFVVAAGFYGFKYSSNIDGSGATYDRYCPDGKNCNEDSNGPIAYYVKFPSLDSNASFAVRYNFNDTLIGLKEFYDSTFSENFMTIGKRQPKANDKLDWKKYLIYGGIAAGALIIIIVIVIIIVCSVRKHKSKSKSTSSKSSSSSDKSSSSS